MLFGTFDFFLFFVLVFLVQRILPHRARNWFLFLASLFFYACWDWRFLSLLLTSICMDYWISHAIHRENKDHARKRWLLLSITVNLSILGFFKYANFFQDSFLQLLSAFGFEGNERFISVLLPVGISFYTFQTMSYTIDVYRKEMVPLKRWVDFGLYVTLFPQMVAGPIERGTHLAAQVLKKTIPSTADIEDGTWLFAKGLFKKSVIADNLAPIVDSIFSKTDYSGPEVLIAVYAFAFQIYCDFSGYTDMARGIGKWMGYDLMLNFRVPFLATDPSDFWKRWHISLSSWLRDYLYIPLGGNRGTPIRTNINLFLTMLLGGLWHGAACNFILWGAFHGLLLVGYRLVGRQSTKQNSKEVPKLPPTAWLFRVVLMFHLVCIGWLMFRANSLEQIQKMLLALLTDWHFSRELWQPLWVLALLASPILISQLLQELTGTTNFTRSLSILPRTAVFSATALAIICLGNFGGQAFLYFQF
jgi:alginate O-acetyltransferase complex protein AlgI